MTSQDIPKTTDEIFANALKQRDKVTLPGAQSETAATFQAEMDKRASQRDAQFMTQFQDELKSKPKFEAEALTIADKLGIPRDQVPNDMDVARHMAKVELAKQLAFDKKYPGIRELMTDVKKVRLIHDDLGNLKSTVDTFDWFWRNIESGEVQNEQAWLYARGAFTELTAKEQDRIAEINEIMSFDASDDGWFDSAARLLGQQIQPITYAAGAGLLAGGITAAASGPAAPVTGTGVGLKVGMGVFAAHAAITEFGREYNTVLTQLIDSGLPPEEAHARALVAGGAYGIGSAALEVMGIKAVGKPILAGTRKFAAKFAGKTLAQKGGGRAFGTAAKEWLKGVSVETGTEGAQEVLAGLVEELIEKTTDVDIEDPSVGEFLTQVGEIMLETFKGMSILGSFGPAMHYTADLGNVQKAKTEGKFFEKLRDNAKESQVAKDHPQTYADMITGAVKGKGPETVYVPADKLDAALETAGQSFEQLEATLPDVAAQLQQARQTNDDITIPIGDYAAHIARSDLHDALKQSIRLDENGFSQDQAADHIKELEENRKVTSELVAKKTKEISQWDAEATAVEARIKTEVSETQKMTGPDAGVVAAAYRSFVEVNAARSDMTPEQFDKAHRLEFQAKRKLPDVADVAMSFRQDAGGATLNVGLDIGDQADAVTPEMLQEALAASGIEPTATEFQRSDSENTAVISLPGALDPQVVHELAAALNQEAVAHRAADGTGFLAGPKAEAWGAFNPEFFLSPTVEATAEFEQSATLRRGTETLKKYGVDPKTRPRVRQVAAALEARTREKYGSIEKGDHSADAEKRIAKWMADEVVFSMGDPSAAGVGWYSTKYQAALDTLGALWPEMLTDKNARNTMTAIVAITSDGNTPEVNMRLAAALYASYRVSGIIAAKRDSNRDVKRNLAKLQKLLADKGPEAAHNFLMEELTVADLNAQARKEGRKPKGDFQPFIKVPRAAALFGPKLGSFYANLMGAHGYLTMDRWWSRTFNRYRGTLIPAISETTLNGYRELVGNPDLSLDEIVQEGIYWFNKRNERALAQKAAKTTQWLSPLEETVGKRPASNPVAQAEWEERARVSLRKDFDLADGNIEALIHEDLMLRTGAGIGKTAIETLNDAPFGAKDRTFMLAATERARKNLKRRGHDMTTADIQAVLWYYEKQLYADMGATASAKIAFDRAAEIIVAERDNKPDKGTRIRKATLGAVDPSDKEFAHGGMGPRVYRDLPSETSYGTATPGASTVVGMHFSNNEQTALSGEFYGRGRSGAESRRVSGDPVLSKRVHFYVDTGKGVRPEPGVGGNVHTVTLNNVYDTDADANGIVKAWRDSGREFNELERAIHAAGFDGIYVPRAQVDQGVVVLLGAEHTNVEVKLQKSDPEFMAAGKEGNAPRGGYSPFSNKAFLYEGADASTFWHEMNHFFLTTMLRMASMPNAPESILKDASVLLKWFGVASLEEWNAMSIDEQRPYHEQFAYNSELYAWENKAPSAELHDIFSRVARWIRRTYGMVRDRLNAIYKREHGVDLPVLTTEVRQVFDRMLASEQAIRSAEAERSMSGMFDERPEGVSDTDWANYVLNQDKASEEAIAGLTRASLAAMKWLSNAKATLIKKLQRETRDIRKQVEGEERARLQKEPVHTARQALRNGKGFDGEPVSVGKINTEIAREMLKNVEGAQLSDLAGLTSQDGAHPETLYGLFNFGSAEQMLQHLVQQPPLDEAVRTATDARMMEEHSELLDEKKMADKVDEVLHNRHREKVIAAELKFLAKASTPVLVIARAAKAFARQAIGAMFVKDLKPHRHRLAETRHRRNADKALVKGDPVLAVSHKRREMLENHQTKEALKAKDEIERALKAFRKLWKTDAKLAAGHDVRYVHIARALLSAFGLGRGEKMIDEHTKQLRENDPELYEQLAPMLSRAAEWLNAATEDGRKVQDYKDLTVEEFRDLKDMVLALWHRSTREKQITVEGKKVAIEGVVDLVVEDSVKENKDAKPGPNGERTLWEKAKDGVKNIVWHGVRPENWFWRRDGGKEGFYTRYFWRPIREAVNNYTKAKSEFTTRVGLMVKALKPRLKQGVIEFKDSKGNLLHTFGRAGGSGHAELVAALLHIGNDSSLAKLLVGRKWGVFNDESQTLFTGEWDAFVLKMVQEGFITPEIMDFVQGVWDLNEELKPLSQRAHFDTMGYYYKEIDAAPVTIPGVGTYRGGYMPAKLDKQARDSGRLRNLKELESDFRQQFVGVGRGFTKARSEHFRQPLMLDLNMIPMHIDEVLKFVHIHPVAKDVERLVKNKKMRDELDRHSPGAWDKLILPWLHRATTQSATTPGKSPELDNFMRSVRTNTGMALMFANLGNTLQQFVGPAIALARVKPRYIINGFYALISERGDLFNRIKDKSKFMEARMDGQMFDSVEVINELQLNASKLKKAQTFARRHAYFMQQGAQNFVDAIVWHGAYEQAMATTAREVHPDKAEHEAAMSADAAVRATQSSFDPTDEASYSTQTPFVKAFLMFTSWFNSMANLQADAMVEISKETGAAKAGKAFYAYLLTFAIPMMGGSAITLGLRGQFEDEDDDGSVMDELFLDFFVMEQLRALAAEVPGIGTAIITPTINMFDSKPWNDRMTSAPAFSVLERAAQGSIQTFDRAIDPKKDVTGKNIRDVMTLMGMLFGLPGATTGKYVGYGFDVSKGNVDPTVRGAISGRAARSERN